MASQIDSRAFRIEHLLFFLSGASALIFEVVWLRDLGLLLGNGAHATAGVLAVFFLGLAVGGGLWGRLSPRFARPLRAYAWLELGVAASALVIFATRGALLEWYPRLHESIAGGSGPALAKAAIGVAILLPPTVLMGGTFPVMGQHLVTSDELGREGARLYAWNTLGAVVGVILAGFILPRALGYRGTYLVALLVTTAVGAAAWAIDRTRGRRAAPVPEPPGALIRREDADGKRSATLVLAFLSGLGTLGIQFLWIRMFALVLQNSVYSFAAILATFLAALAGGALLATHLSRRAWNSTILLGILFVVSGVAVALSGPTFLVLTDGLTYVTVTGGWADYVRSMFRLSALTILLPGVMLGAIFPYLLKTLEGGVRDSGPVIGRLVMANSAGAVVGPLLAGLFLSPWLGLWATTGVLALVYLLTGTVLLGRTAAPVALRLTPVIGVLLLVGVLPLAVRPRLNIPAGARLGGVWHGSLGTVSIIEDGGNLSLILDNHYTLGDTRSLGTERLQAHIPLLLHPDPRSVFFLGLGTGITAGAALDHGVEKVVVAELVPEVVDAARTFFEPYANGLFGDPRVRLVADDGRFELNASQDVYDVIIADLFTPWHAGTGTLYSVEHYRRVYSRLTEDGVFAQWLAGYQLSEDEFSIIVRSMLEVFPQITLWRGNFSPDRPVMAVVGGTAASLDLPAFRANVQRLFAPGTDLAGWEAVGGLFYAGNLSAQRDRFADYRLNTIDQPIVEFIAPIEQSSYLTGGTSRLVEDELAGFYQELSNHTPPDSDPFLASATPELRNGIRAGSSFFQYRLHTQAGRPTQAGKSRAEFARLLPTELAEFLNQWISDP